MKQKRDEIHVEVWTEHFLGTSDFARSFFCLIDSVDGGRWMPQRANAFEPVRRAYTEEAKASLVEEWTQERHGRTNNVILFTRRSPKLLAMVTVWRGRVPDLNRIHLWLAADEFKSDDGPARIVGIVQGVVDWCGAVYASAYHSRQSHMRAAGGTPMKRLDHLSWLTFFGKPYVSLFSEEAIRSAAFAKLQTTSGGVLALAAARPDSPEMIDSPDHLLAIENRLGKDVFADDYWSENVRRTAHFDLSETVVKSAAESASTVLN